jgi:hypothetical protein
MTAKRSISVPDDVAAWLDQQDNVSAAVTDAVRAQMKTNRIEDLLAARGITVTEAGKARWREQLAQPIPADALAEGRRMAAAAAAGKLGEYRAGRWTPGE